MCYCSSSGPALPAATVRRHARNPKNRSWTGKNLLPKLKRHSVAMLLLFLLQIVLSFIDGSKSAQIDPTPGRVELFSLPFSPSQRKFSVAIEEENRLGDVVFRVVPSPESGAQSFSMIDIAPNCSGAPYFIVSNASAGEIRLSHLLDYEKTQALDLDVRAWLAQPAYSNLASSAIVTPMAHALVGVQVVNINDHQPTFDAPKDRLTGELYAQVPENSPPGTLVAELHASDVDPGEVGEMRYIIVGVAPGTPIGFADAFGLDPVEGSLRVINSSLLDRESIREVDLLVAAVDNPNRPNRQYAAINRLTIALIDENDNAPKFNQSSIEVLPPVCECAVPGYLVTIVTADDLDESSRNQLSYRIVDANVTFSLDVPSAVTFVDPKSLFSIEQYSGRISVTAHSLEGLIGRYSLLVEVCDQGGLTARTLVTFNVTSDNKFAPEFTITGSAWTDQAAIMENLPPDTRVFPVTATDKDTFGSSNQIEFYFLEPSNQSLVSQVSTGFRINKNTGVIYSTRSFDAETDAPFFNVSVVARDRGTPPQQTNATLRIRILDQDELPPRWPVSPSDGCNMQFNFWLPEKSPIGGRVGRVWSDDDDRTNRSYFRLEPRNDAKYFAVNPATGIITIANPDPNVVINPGQEVGASFLDYEDREHRDFVLFVAVSPMYDGGQSAVTSPPGAGVTNSATPTGCLRGNVARVHIHLTNMEDARPAFSRGSKPYYYCVAGDAVRNTLVSRYPDITATDLDSSKIVFRMTSSEWRAAKGFVSVSCAFRLQQPPVPPSQPALAQLVVNSPIGNYSGSYFRIPIDARDPAGLTASSLAYVWVTPAESDSHSAAGHSLSTDLVATSSSSEFAVIQPPPPPQSSYYYATVTVAQRYDVFLSELSQWVDCVSERLLAGDRFLAGAPICITDVAPSSKDPNHLTVIRMGAASKSEMLLVPAALLVASLQQQINATGGGLCGVIDASCSGCKPIIPGPITYDKLVAGPPGGDFDPLALLIALAVLLLFLIALLLLLLALCCKVRRKKPILIPPPIALREERIEPAVPIFEVKPGRLYETQEAYMCVEPDQQMMVNKGFEEQEIILDEGEEGETEEVFEIPLPREYETQTVLLDMPTWAANGEFGHNNPTLILDHGACETQQLPLHRQNGARLASGSVYSEPYYKSSYSEQRAFSMLHIDTRQGQQQQGGGGQHQHPPVSYRQPVAIRPTNTVDCPSPISAALAGRQFVMLPAPALTPPSNTNSSDTGQSSPNGPGRISPAPNPNLAGGVSYIARRLGEPPPPPISTSRNHSRQAVETTYQTNTFSSSGQQQYHQSQQPQQQYNHQQQLQQLQQPSSIMLRPATMTGGLLRPAMSADSITILAQQQQQQARRAALEQQQQHPNNGQRHHSHHHHHQQQQYDHHLYHDELHAEMRQRGGSYRTDESEPTDEDEARLRRQLGEDDYRGGGSGRLRRSRSLPKYLQPPAELQSVMAELHDYIKSPEQKARRRRISQKYRAKLVASGGVAAVGDQQTETSSSSDSLERQQLQRQQQQQQQYNNRNIIWQQSQTSNNQQQHQQKDYLMF